MFILLIFAMRYLTPKPVVPLAREDPRDKQN